MFVVTRHAGVTSLTKNEKVPNCGGKVLRGSHLSCLVTSLRFVGPINQQRVALMSNYTIVSRDLREGMSIGGWDMEYTITDQVTGCSITYQTHGGYPRSQHAMRQHALACIDLLTEVYCE